MTDFFTNLFNYETDTKQSFEQKLVGYEQRIDNVIKNLLNPITELNTPDYKVFLI